MEQKLREDLDKIKSECERLGGLGFKADGEQQELWGSCRLAMMKMLIYICLLDANIKGGETDFINSALGTSLTKEDVDKFSSGDTAIGADDPISALQKICRVLINATFAGKSGISVKAFISTVNALGVAFIASDGSADERETAYLGSLTFRLKVFCDSYIKNLEKVNKKKLSEVEKSIAEPEKPKDDDKTLDELLEKLDKLIGLENVKQEVYSLSNLIKVRNLRQERGFEQPEMSLHLVFTGNPGTGKTTVARLISQIYYKLGAVKKNVFVEVDRSGLVSNYIGHTALKTKEVCQSAFGGVLFIDEAYALTCGTGKNDFGQEAVNTLLKFMEDNRGDIVIICAGYTDLMEEFLQSNPGLRSRFNRFIEFADYTADELTDMFRLFCSQYRLEPNEEALETVRAFFVKRIDTKTEYFANGRDARNLFERVLSKQADRIAPLGSLSDEDLLAIIKEDVEGIEL